MRAAKNGLYFGRQVPRPYVETVTAKRVNSDIYLFVDDIHKFTRVARSRPSD